MEEVRQSMRELIGTVAWLNLSTQAFTYRLLLERHLPSMIQSKELLKELMDETGINTVRTYDEWGKVNA